jgi:hypothetical protein
LVLGTACQGEKALSKKSDIDFNYEGTGAIDLFQGIRSRVSEMGHSLECWFLKETLPTQHNQDF